MIGHCLPSSPNANSVIESISKTWLDCKPKANSTKIRQFEWQEERVDFRKEKGRTISFKWAIPGLFFVYFRFFKITIFTTYICEKCPSSILCWDSNPQPSDSEHHPITTRPGLPDRTNLTNFKHTGLKLKGNFNWPNFYYLEILN